MPRPLNLSGRPSLHLAVSDMKRSIDFYTTQLGFFYDHGVDNLACLTRPEIHEPHLGDRGVIAFEPHAPRLAAADVDGRRGLRGHTVR